MLALLARRQAAPQGLLASLRAAAEALGFAEVGASPAGSTAGRSADSSRLLAAHFSSAAPLAAEAAHRTLPGAAADGHLASAGGSRSSSHGSSRSRLESSSRTSSRGAAAAPDAAASSSPAATGSHGQEDGGEQLQAVAAKEFCPLGRPLRLEHLDSAPSTPSSRQHSAHGARSSSQAVADHPAAAVDGPVALRSAVRKADSCAAVARLLLANRSMLSSHLLTGALVRMALLVRDARRPPDEDEREVFLGTRELLFGLLEREGRRLSLAAACLLLQASGWVHLPLTPEQQPAVEAVVVPAWHAAKPQQLQELMSGYILLNMRPGPELAALLTPALCRAAGYSPSWGEEEGAAAPAEQQQAQAEEEEQPRLSSHLLSLELLRAGRLGQGTHVMRLLLHHADQLNRVHLFIALEALAKVGQSQLYTQQQAEQAPAEDPPAVGGPAVLETFRLLREVAIDTAHAEQLDAEHAMHAARLLLHTSGLVGLPLAPAEQEAVEAVAVKGLHEATSSDLRLILAAYHRLGMRPLAGSGLAGVLAEAAERLLPVATAKDLQAILPAWQALGFEPSERLQAAAEAAALRCLVAGLRAADLHHLEPLAADAGLFLGVGLAPGHEEVWLSQEPQIDGNWLRSQQARTQPLLRLVMRLLEAHSLSGWPLGAELEAELARTLPHCLLWSNALLAARALGACLVLNMHHAHDELAAAFLRAAPGVMPGASPHQAASFAGRLLIMLKQRHWHFLDASPQEQQAAATTMLPLLPVVQRLGRRRPHSARQGRAFFTQWSRELGELCRWLHLLAMLGLQPPPPTLEAVCHLFRQPQQGRMLSKRQRQWLAWSLGIWGWGPERHRLPCLEGVSKGSNRKATRARSRRSGDGGSRSGGDEAGAEAPAEAAAAAAAGGPIVSS